jgi:hypothetical protein
MMQRRLTGLAALVLLASCASDDNRTPRAEQRWVADGASVSCISRNQIRSTSVPDGSTINFETSNRRMFSNALPVSCPGLANSRAFKMNSRSGQLCSSSTITVIIPGGTRGATCALGRFQPMVRATDTPVGNPG